MHRPAQAQVLGVFAADFLRPYLLLSCLRRHTLSVQIVLEIQTVPSVSHPPIMFLAFANDRGGDSGYLRNLPEEARQVYAVLDGAAQAGLCEVIMHQNVTVDTVLDIFQDTRYRNRIAIFHYGGHAESCGLLLKTAEGKSAATDAGASPAKLRSSSEIKSRGALPHHPSAIAPAA